MESALSFRLLQYPIIMIQPLRVILQIQIAIGTAVHT
jgi:hypothetical protein